MGDLTAKDIFEQKIPERLRNNPDVAKQINNVYQFNLTGDESGTWCIDLRKSDGWITEGANPDAKCTLTLSSKDFVDVVSGKLNAQMAFMQGRLKVQGDIGLAMKLRTVLGS